MIDNGGHAMVGIHAQEVLGELIAALDIDRCDFVFEAAFLQKDGDLLAIGRGPIENLDHCPFSLPGRRKVGPDYPTHGHLAATLPSVGLTGLSQPEPARVPSASAPARMAGPPRCNPVGRDVLDTAAAWPCLCCP